MWVLDGVIWIPVIILLITLLFVQDKSGKTFGNGLVSSVGVMISGLQMQSFKGAVRCSLTKLFRNILKNSLEKTYSGVLFLVKFKAWT